MIRRSDEGRRSTTSAAQTTATPPSAWQWLGIRAAIIADSAIGRLVREWPRAYHLIRCQFQRCTYVLRLTFARHVFRMRGFATLRAAAVKAPNQGPPTKA